MDDQQKPAEQPEPEEGGEVAPLSDVPFEPARHKAQTAAKIAYALLAILAFSIGVQYACTMVLICWGSKDSLDFLSKIFNAWLPVISGLVSAAATYYFTKEH